jgi:hypothetical protein
MSTAAPRASRIGSTLRLTLVMRSAGELLPGTTTAVWRQDTRPFTHDVLANVNHTNESRNTK